MPPLALVWDLVARDNASPAFTRVGEAAEKSAAKTESASRTMSGALVKAGAVAGAAGIAFAAVSVKMAADFQVSVTKLATTAGESQKNLKMVGDGMLKMAGQVGLSAGELAKGMYTVESAGFHGANALTVLKAAAQGAVQEQADLGKVTDAVTTALHDYNLPASDAAKVTSQLITAVSHGKTTFDELTGAMHSVTPLAAALHVPLADIAGSLSAMTASGESADQAAQNMADALRHLQGPTQPMINELAQLGINASDLSKNLGTQGLSGTIQGISEAILRHMGPAGTLMLSSFNQSKIAAQDAATMFANLPPKIQAVAKAYESGKMSVGDWRLAMKGMPADQAMLATAWKNMTDRASGFSQILKSGSPQAQTYTVALQKAMGTAAGLTVALQLTGEHAASTNAAIADIAKASGDASGNIKGWTEVQGNFNQKLHEAEAAAGALAIQFGQQLLPVLTQGMDWVVNDGIPGLKSLGSAVGSVTDWFKGLPAPIQNVALTLVGLRIADHIGLFDRLGSTVGGLRTAFAGFRDEIALQQTLWAMNERSITSAGRGYSEVGSILSTTQGSLQAASAGVGRFGATLSTLSARSLPALKAAGTSVMNLFGGPWGVALGAAVLVLPTFIDGIKQMTGHVIDATAAQQGFTQSLLATNGVMDQSIRKDIQQALLKANLADVFRAAGISARDAIDGIAGNAAAQERVNKALQAYILANPGTVHNKVATAAMNARNAFNQLTTAFGGSVAAAKYFAGSADTATHKTDGATASVKSLTAAIHALPDGHVSVTADTGPAVRSINDMLATYRSQVINLRAAMPQIPGVQRLGTYASGGYTGPGSKYTPAGIVHANEFVFPSEAVNRLGTSFLGALAGLPGYASGGLVGGMDVGTIRTSVNMDTSGVSGPLAAMIASLKAALVPAVGPIGSGVERWRGTVDAVLRALGQSLSLDNGILSLISHESGGNPGAINLTDSNARAGHPSQGLMQTIPSTFYAYAGPYASRGILDPFANIYAGTNYALNRYGAGMLLQGGNHVGGKYVGYEKGTPFVPSDGLAYLHKGEAVIPAKHNRGGTTITLQLDRMAVTDLLEGRIVTALDGLTARGDYNP